jgi:hypothetical protein
MRLGKFKILIFIFATIICCFLTFITLVGAGAVEEGTEERGILGAFSILLLKLFYVFRFPTNALFFEFMDSSIFFIGLFINCIIYGFVTERIISLFKRRQISKGTIIAT